jgi:hypothetical protein
VAFDVSGNGKTVAKATWGRFNDDLGLREYSVSFSANQPLQYNYRWHDLNGDGNYQPGEVNLDLNGSDYLSVNPGPGFGAVGAGNNVVNPDLFLPHTNEGSASLERELGQGLSVRGLFVYKKLYDAITNVNLLRPPSVYDQVFTRKDPGPDGLLNTTDDGQFFTIYDYNPAYRGNAFVKSMNLNRPADRNDSFKNLEIMLTKRPIGRWFANTAVLATKNHRYVTGVVQSPKRFDQRPDSTGKASYRLAGGYRLPARDLRPYAVASGIHRDRATAGGERLRATDPAGGPAFPSSTPSPSAWSRSAPSGRRPGNRQPAWREEIRARGSQDYRSPSTRSNAFNSNVAWGGGSNGSELPTHRADLRHVVGIVTPRVLRFGITYEF